METIVFWIGGLTGLHVYSDRASGRHVNELAGVESPERFPAALAGVEEAERNGAPVEWCPCEPADEAALAAIHDAAYLDHLRGMSRAGGGYLSLDTAVGEGSWEAASLASGAACSTVESALDGETAFAVARPPGHHAGRDYGMGFCLTNHAAVAAGHALSMGLEKVAILDWDVHHGNGTQDIFYSDDRVLYLSVHQSPFYPGTGEAGEVGEGEGRGFTANVPLPAGSGEDLYAAVFAGVFVPVLREFGPGLVLVSAGFDAHADDLLGGMALTSDAFGRFAALVTHLSREVGAAPPAFILEGGYNLKALTEGVAATMQGVGAEAPDWEYAGGVRQVEKSREILAPFWRGVG
jgi:acetoin utilization deacetylase AcuC-like enzyme